MDAKDTEVNKKNKSPLPHGTVLSRSNNEEITNRIIKSNLKLL